VLISGDSPAPADGPVARAGRAAGRIAAPIAPGALMIIRRDSLLMSDFPFRIRSDSAAMPAFAIMTMHAKSLSACEREYFRFRTTTSKISGSSHRGLARAPADQAVAEAPIEERDEPEAVGALSKRRF
jgi:hypothetical protein